MKNKLLIGVLLVFVMGITSVTSAFPVPFVQNVTYSNSAGSGLGVVPGETEYVSFDIVYHEHNTESFKGAVYVVCDLGMLLEQLVQPNFTYQDVGGDLQYAAWLANVSMDPGDTLHFQFAVEAKENANSGTWGLLGIVPISDDGVFVKATFSASILYEDGGQYPDPDDLIPIDPTDPIPIDPFADLKALISMILDMVKGLLIGIFIGMFMLPGFLERFKRNKDRSKE